MSQVYDHNARVVMAPEVFGLDARSVFRVEAGDMLAALPEGSGSLVVDFSSTRRIDSAGLGALMLVQRLAAERHQKVVLRCLKDEFRYLLVLTKLDDLFEIETV